MANEADNETFFERVLDATPRGVIVLFSVIMGASISFGFFLTTTGLQDPFKRVIDVYVKRLETSVDKLEMAATDMRAIVTRLENSEKDLTDLGKRVSTLESESQEHARRIRDLEIKSQLGKK